jgi:hypothetical protein
MATKLFITNERMLKLMDWAVSEDLAIDNADFLEKIGFTRTNIYKVKAGTNGFTNEQIWNACKLTGASADYIFGFTNSMMRKQPAKGVDLLKQAVHTVELELNRK